MGPAASPKGGPPPDGERSVDVEGPYDFDETVRFLPFGRRGPTCRRGPGQLWKPGWTPDGPATLQIRRTPVGLAARAWGAGSAWALERVPAFVGLEDDPARLRAPPGPFAALGTGFHLRADAVVTAIGQDPQLAPLRWLAPGDAALIPADARGATAHEGVFAGGDAASMQRFVTHAVGMGKRAAIAIDCRLKGEQAVPQGARAPVPYSAISTWYHARAPRAEGARRAAASVEAALDEAARCFSCGECTHCDNCFTSCPDMAVRHVNGGYAIDEKYCKGCGLCVRECPTGSVAMREEAR